MHAVALYKDTHMQLANYEYLLEEVKPSATKVP